MSGALESPGKISGKLLGTEGTSKEARAAAAKAAEAAKFKPVNIAQGQGLFGSQFDVDPETGEVRQARATQVAGLGSLQGQLLNQLSPAFQQQQQGDPTLGLLGDLLAQRGVGGTGAQAGIDQALQRELGLFEQIQAPQRQAQREELNARLLAQGRLGSTAGADVEAELERRFAEQQAQAGLTAVDRARAAQSQQFGQGLQQLGLGAQLLQGQQERGQGLFGNILGTLLQLEQARREPIALGAQLGGAQASAGANVGTALQTGSAQSGAARGKNTDFISGLITGAASGGNKPGGSK